MRRYTIDVLRLLTFLSEVGRILNVDRGESSSTHSTIRRYENIRGARDTRSYRGLKLGNDLQILLISCPNLTSSAVAMTVKVGSLNDFEEVPGIALLVGEMINRFGSSSNPEQEFMEIVNSRLSQDALNVLQFPETDEDEQLFHFEINANYLTPALEIFGQFFNEPFLMLSNSINPLQAHMEQMNWWDSIVYLGESSNKSRFWQMIKSISAENHPLNHSPYGNTVLFNKYLEEEVTSGESEPLLNRNAEPRQTRLHDEIRKFYSKWYSSNLMCLVVLGKESLDQLERITVPLFENLPNKHVEPLHFTYEKHPWKEEQIRLKIYSALNAQFTNDNGFVRLVFQVPDIQYQYKTAPEMYVTYILNHGGPGSLIFVLQQRQLCSHLKSSYDVKAGIGFFTFKCEIPHNKEIYEDEIVKLIIQYIRFIKTFGIHEWIFEENRRYNETMFSNSLLADSVEHLASAMQKYPIEDILSYKYCQDEWKPKLIKEFLAHLTPENLNVFIDHTKFQDVIEDQNTWHNIPYKVEKIPEALIESWKTLDISSDFHIPSPNEFLVANWDIHPLRKDEPEIPYVVHETPRSRFWFLQDNNSAKVQIKFDLIDLKWNLNPTTSTLLCIFTQLLHHLILEHKYALYVSGYEWKITSGDNFVNFYLHGYSDKIQILLKKIMTKISADHLTGSHLYGEFENAKRECIYRENNRKNHFSVMHHIKNVLTEMSACWSPHEIMAASQSLNLEDWVKFISRILSGVFVQGLILGNCVRQSAIDIAKIIEMPFESTAKPISQEMLSLLPRVVEIEEGRHFLDIILKDSKEQLHNHHAYYQFGAGTHHIVTISSLLLDMIQGICRDIFRNFLLTRYYIFKINGVIGLLFWSYPTDYHADYIDSLFENCLRKIHVSLQKMSDFVFEEHARRVIEKKIGTPSSSFWDDINFGFYGFEQDVDEGAMNPLTKGDILSFFDDTLLESSPRRRKYTLLTYSKNSDWKTLSVIPGTTRIEDVMKFKNNSNLLPLPYPFMRLNL